MRGLIDAIANWLGQRLSGYFSQTTCGDSTAAPAGPITLMACIQPGDGLLVAGQSRVTVAIKYLTQSTWSHAALYVGDATGLVDGQGRPGSFLEADIGEGVRAVSLAEFEHLHSRICRPAGLDSAEIAEVIALALARLGDQYDLKNVIDLAGYLLPTPPVPVRWRRRMLAPGSGDPTCAICSTLIAQAFQSVRYPIMPRIELLSSDDPQCRECVAEILDVRHHSLFVAQDFDVSPYFAIVKPTLEYGFKHRSLRWHGNHTLAQG